MVDVLQHIAVSKPARSTVGEPVSKEGDVALAGHDALKVPVHFYPEFVAIADKYRFQVGSLSGDPGEEVRDLLSLAMLGRRHQHQLWPLSVDQAAAADGKIQALYWTSCRMQRCGNLPSSWTVTSSTMALEAG